MQAERIAVATRDEYRVVTTFNDFDVWDNGAQRYVTRVDHRNVSMTYSTLAGAEQGARGMRRLHGEAAVARNSRTPTIKSQLIQRRTVSTWDAVDA